jgi:hypothetical protein
MEDAPAAEAE